MAKIGRIVLHIGKHKTGSSSIQASLAGLDADGVRYAGLSRSNHSDVMRAGFALQRRERKNDRKQRYSPDNLAEQHTTARNAVAAALEEPCRTLIFSGEEMENFDHHEVEDLVGFLRGHTSEIIVVGFVRPPRSAQLSGFGERVKHGYAKRRLVGVDYRKTFAPYIQVLGLDAVKVLAFDPPSFHNGSLVETFMRAIGEPDIAYTETRANEAMPADAVRLLFLRNQDDKFPLAGGKNYRARQKLWRVLAAEIPGAKLSLPDECHFARKASEEVEWLHAVSGIDFSADLARMMTDPKIASRALSDAMAEISEPAIERLRELVAAETGEAAPASPLNAMRKLYRAYGGRVQVR